MGEDIEAANSQLAHSTIRTREQAEVRLAYKDFDFFLVESIAITDCLDMKQADAELIFKSSFTSRVYQ